MLNADGRYFAIDDACSHACGSPAQGEVAAKAVSCPLHGAKLDLETGAALSSPAFEAVHVCRVEVAGGEVKLLFEE